MSGFLFYISTFELYKNYKKIYGKKDIFHIVKMKYNMITNWVDS